MNRTAFLSSSATLVAAGVALPAAAAAVPGGTHFVERKADFDEAAFAAIVGRAADIRQLFESVAFKPGLFGNVKNALNGLQFGYGYAPTRIVMAVAGHGASSAFTYSEYVWQKYRIGEFFGLKDADGNAIASNTFFAAKNPYDIQADPDDEKGMYQDASIEMLQKRGVIMLTCHTAVEEQSKAIVKRGFAPAGTTAQDVASDILTHLIPGALVNPSMVATVAVLQARYHYTYAALTF